MSDKVPFGIISPSLFLTAALIWGGAGLTMLFTQWISEHPDVAKAMALLPILVMPIVALVLYCRRNRAAIRSEGASSTATQGLRFRKPAR